MKKLDDFSEHFTKGQIIYKNAYKKLPKRALIEYLLAMQGYFIDEFKVEYCGGVWGAVIKCSNFEKTIWNLDGDYSYLVELIMKNFHSIEPTDGNRIFKFNPCLANNY